MSAGVDRLTGDLLHLLRCPTGIDSPGPIAHVLRTGDVVRLPDQREPTAGRADSAAAKAVECASALIVPLRVRGRVCGALSLAAHAPRRYEAADLPLVEELGRRAALAADQSRLEKEGIEAARQFLGMMVHEFRTPAHIVTMFADLLLMGVPEPLPAAAHKHAQQIRTAGEHLNHLVDQVMTFSRLEARRESARNVVTDLVSLAGQTASLIEPLARQKQLCFAVDLPTGPVHATTDPDKLRQVLFNLLGNAVKFTESGEVRLVLTVDDASAVFEVRDTGVGIAPEHREKVFEPFWQVDRESVRGAKGTGLGLNIVQRYVQLLGGSVGLSSGAAGGSVFRVVLPLEHEA